MINENELDAVAAATVYDRDGDKVGRVGQVYFDDNTNQPSWVTVATGLFGTSESFVPLDERAQLSGDRLEVPYEKSLIKDAPRIDSDRHLSREEEEELYRHYDRDYNAGFDRGDVDRDRDLVDTDRDRDLVDTDRDRDRDLSREGSMTASEERLKVGTEQAEAGRVRLRRHVTTEQQTVSVPVEKEVLRVEREAVSGDTRREGSIGDGDGEVEEIVLREERPVVSKEVHEVERVNLAKETVTEEHQVSADVKKEHIEVEGDGVADDGDRRV